jgi:hypothetical protein
VGRQGRQGSAEVGMLGHGDHRLRLLPINQPAIGLLPKQHRQASQSSSND